MKAQVTTEKAPTTLTIDVTDQKKKLAGYLDAKANVAAYVVALQNTNISGVNFKTLPKDLQDKLPEAPAALLAKVNKNLSLAKQHGQTWSNDIQPGLTAIPQAVIDFNSSFQSEVTFILPRLQYLIDHPNDAEKRQELVGLFNGLINKIVEQETAVGNEISLLKQFNTDVTNDHGNFSKANSSFFAIEQFEEANIVALNSAIEGLEETINVLTGKITAEAIGLGVSAAVIAGGVGLLAVPGVGPFLGAGVILVGLVGVGVSLGFLVEDLKRRQKAQQEEAFDQLEVTELTIQVQALKTVEKALSNLVDRSGLAMASVQVILDTWGTLKGKIESVVKDLGDSEKDIGSVVSCAELNDAATQWNQLQEFAGEMQGYESKTFANLITLQLQPMVVKMAA
jgi:hypothetical protein